MSYMVCHGMKSKAGDVKNIEKHIERKNKDYKNKDIDKSRTHLNYDLHYERYQSYKNRINERIKEEYTGTRAIRKDAIFMVNFIISSDQEFFKNLSEERQREYFKISYDYLKDYFGEKNVISSKVHLDETTPHMHFTAIPLVDGKLNSKKLMTRGFLRKIQSELPEILKNDGFEIERGIEGSKRKHIETETYKKELNAELGRAKFEIKELKKEQNALESILSHSRNDLEVIDDIDTIKTRKTILGANRSVSEGNYQKILNSFKKIVSEKRKLERENIELKKDLETKEIDIDTLKRSNNYLKRMKSKAESKFIDKFNELERIVSNNSKEIRDKLSKAFEREYHGVIEDLNIELKKAKDELKNSEEKKDFYKEQMYSLQSKIMDLGGENLKLEKDLEFTNKFLKEIGKLEECIDFVDDEYEKEDEEENEIEIEIEEQCLDCFQYSYRSEKEDEYEMSL